MSVNVFGAGAEGCADWVISAAVDMLAGVRQTKGSQCLPWGRHGVCGKPGGRWNEKRGEENAGRRKKLVTKALYMKVSDSTMQF